MSRRKKRKYNTLKIMALVIFVGFIVVVAYNAIQNSADKEESTGEKITQETEKEDNDIINDKVIAIEKEADKEDKVVENNEEDRVDNEEEDNQANKNIYKTSLAGQSLSFEYPSTWQANSLEEENKFSFGPAGKAVAAEYQGDIIIVYKENKTKKPIERYYDGLNDINLFEDASGGFEMEEGGKYTFYTFKDVIGYTSSTIGVFVLNDSFVEMTDIYNKHQDDGVFSQLIQSFKAE